MVRLRLDTDGEAVEHLKRHLLVGDPDMQIVEMDDAHYYFYPTKAQASMFRLRIEEVSRPWQAGKDD